MIHRVMFAMLMVAPIAVAMQVPASRSAVVKQPQQSPIPDIGGLWGFSGEYEIAQCGRHVTLMSSIYTVNGYVMDNGGIRLEWISKDGTAAYLSVHQLVGDSLVGHYVVMSEGKIDGGVLCGKTIPDRMTRCAMSSPGVD